MTIFFDRGARSTVAPADSAAGATASNAERVQGDAEEALDPGPRHLDRVELRTVGGQVQRPGAALRQRLRDTGDLVDAWAVQYDNVAGLQERSQVVAQKRHEHLAVDVPFYLAQREYALQRDRSDETDATTVGRPLDQGRTPDGWPAPKARFLRRQEAGVRTGLATGAPRRIPPNP